MRKGHAHNLPANGAPHFGLNFKTDMSNSISRRDVLKGATIGAIGLGLAGVHSEASQSKRSKSDRLRIGIIGVGGKGWSGMEQAAQHGDIVALCDVNAKDRAKGMEEYPRASTFDDYRIMLETLHNQMDAVIISTPDHHHAPASAMAMRYGLHCYTEKPLTRTIWESRQLQRIARESKVATQMGNQSTSYSPMRRAAAHLRAGTFGAVKEVHLWTDRAAGWWGQGVERPDAQLAPKHIDFKLWLGPRPLRAYSDKYVPFAWRGWWDFGTGALGDMGCHIFNMSFMGLDLRDPISVQAKTSGHNRDSFPAWSIVDYEFAANKNRGPVKLTWHDGGKRPDPALCPGETYGGNGSIVVCEKGTIYAPDESNNTFRLIGGGTIPDIQIDESPGHMAEFARAAMGGVPAVSNIPFYSGPLTETVLLGNLAIWADGPKLEWDAKKMKVKGTDEFDSLIKPAFEPGWAV